MLNKYIEHTSWTYCKLIPHFHHGQTLKKRTTRKEDQLGGLQLFGHLAVATKASHLSQDISGCFRHRHQTPLPLRTLQFLETSCNISQQSPIFLEKKSMSARNTPALRAPLMECNANAHRLARETSIIYIEKYAKKQDKSFHQQKSILKRCANNSLGKCRTSA